MPEARVLFCCWGACQQTVPYPENAAAPGICPHCRRVSKWLIVRGFIGERTFELNAMDKKFLKSIRVAPE